MCRPSQTGYFSQSFYFVQHPPDRRDNITRGGRHHQELTNALRVFLRLCGSGEQDLDAPTFHACHTGERNTVVLARGTQGVPAFIAGFVAGALLWFAIAATGLAALAATFATVFLAIRYLCAAYLLYLAWKFWTAVPRAVNLADARTSGPDGYGRLFLAGLAIDLGNPKVILFFLALLPTVVNVDRLTPPDFAELAAIIIAIASAVLAAYDFLASRARRLFSSTRPSGWARP